MAEDADCPICFEPIGRSDAFVASCMHSFHGSCILNAARRIPQSTDFRCPLCRGLLASATSPQLVREVGRIYLNDLFVPPVPRTDGGTITLGSW